MITSGMVGYHAALEPLLVPIDSVHQWPDNYNAGDVDAIIASIETNGMYRPLYVQTSTGAIVAGNHTWEACKSLGAEQVPVVYLDIDDPTARRLLVADNRIASLARPDLGLLVDLLHVIDEESGLLGTGYDETDLTALLAATETPVTYDEHNTWPTLCFTVPPEVKHAFLSMTEVAVGDRERFDLLLRMAGWDGSPSL